MSARSPCSARSNGDKDIGRRREPPVLGCYPLGMLKDASTFRVLVVQKVNHIAGPITEEAIHGHTSDYDGLTGEHVIYSPVAIGALAEVEPFGCYDVSITQPMMFETNFRERSDWMNGKPAHR